MDWNLENVLIIISIFYDLLLFNSEIKCELMYSVAVATAAAAVNHNKPPVCKWH